MPVRVPTKCNLNQPNRMTCKGWEYCEINIKINPLGKDNIRYHKNYTKKDALPRVNADNNLVCWDFSLSLIFMFCSGFSKRKV